MGNLIDFGARRKAKDRSSRDRSVGCAHCGESHPIVRLDGGSLRCLTAFRDGDNWFCRNRGCRAAWLARQAEPEG